MRYIIAGMSAAWVRAAETIRQRGHAAGIVTISNERLPCSCRLDSCNLAGHLDQGSLLYGRRGIAEDRGRFDQPEMQELVETVGV